MSVAPKVSAGQKVSDNTRARHFQNAKFERTISIESKLLKFLIEMVRLSTKVSMCFQKISKSEPYKNERASCSQSSPYCLLASVFELDCCKRFGPAIIETRAFRSEQGFKHFVLNADQFWIATDKNWLCRYQHVQFLQIRAQ